MVEVCAPAPHHCIPHKYYPDLLLSSLTSAAAFHHSIPSLFPQQMEEAICLMCCETASRFAAANHSDLSALCLCLPLYVSLKANLVAAFEQSLALMTARLQNLSVSSEQKVFWLCPDVTLNHLKYLVYIYLKTNGYTMKWNVHSYMLNKNILTWSTQLLCLGSCQQKTWWQVTWMFWKLDVCQRFTLWDVHVVLNHSTHSVILAERG